MGGTLVPGTFAHDAPAERAAPSPAAGRAEATSEERAAAVAMLQMISGVHISRAVYVMAELGIADLTASASMRSWARLVDSAGAFGAFDPIIETVRSGQPAFDIVHGMDLFGFLAAHPDRALGFQAAMSERTAAFAPGIAAHYDFALMRTVADIGGKGTLLAAILRAHDHLRGVLFDRPEVVAGASGVLQAAGVADRCEIVSGDFFRGVPEGADGYILANVLHDWDDLDSARILNKCRQAMAPDGRVLIVERLIPDDPAHVVPVLLSDLMMLVVTGGQERTDAECAHLLAEADLKLASVPPVASPYGVIEGLPRGWLPGRVSRWAGW
jgi:hypothetical protein